MVLLPFAFLMSVVITATPVFAAQLVMVEQRGCPWCARWKAEIGIVYNKTDEGKRAPLRVIDIHKDWPSDLEKVPRERFTPTFILVDQGVEVERIYGYQGEEAFWFKLGQMLKKLN